MLREMGEVGEPAIFKTSNPDNSLNAGINNTLVPERSRSPEYVLRKFGPDHTFVGQRVGFIATGRVVNADPGC